MFHERYRKVISAFLFLFVALAIRLAYIQLYKGESLYRAATAQRINDFNIEKPRGDILDRNGIPFTNRNEKFYVVLKPFYLKGRDDELKKVCSLLKLDFTAVKSEVESKKAPLVFETGEAAKNAVMGLRLQGVSAINSLRRYDTSGIAAHVIGYLNGVDQTGEAGIEKYYEDALAYDKKNSIGIVTDARNNIMQGLGYRLFKRKGENEKLNVKLTLDYHIQKIAEDVMEEKGIKGAVVIQDVLSGDILAMASKPGFDQSRVEYYLDSHNNELFNRATASYNLGSIFKIVDAALIIENEDNPWREFFCPGYIDVGDIIFKCPSFEEGGHGWVNLEEAFAHSCNPYFIDASIRTGYHKIIEKAREFGLGECTGIWEQGVSESAGNLPDYDAYYSDGDIANIALGQGEIMATPLQVSNMVATIANGGIRNRPNIADSIIDEEGNKVRELKKREWKRVVSKETADKLKVLMEEVTTSGTGYRASLKEYGGSGGKTGSAETGRRDVVHAWFAGYFPKTNPKYSMAVFIENGKSGGSAAAPVFEEIAERIMTKGL